MLIVNTLQKLLTAKVIPRACFYLCSLAEPQITEPSKIPYNSWYLGVDCKRAKVPSFAFFSAQAQHNLLSAHKWNFLYVHVRYLFLFLTEIIIRSSIFMT